MSKAKLHNVYLIDSRHINENNEAFVKRIMKKWNDEHATNQYKLQKILSSDENKGYFKIFPYYSKENKDTAEIVEFCKAFIHPDEDILKIKPVNHNVVIFISGKNNLFAICGGQGHRVVKEFCKEDFGMIYLTNEVDNSLSSWSHTNTSKITTNVLSESRSYRNEIPIYSLDTIDTILKSFSGSIIKPDDGDLSKCGIFKNMLDKKEVIGFNAGDSLTIRTRLDYRDLLKVLRELDAKDQSIGELRLNNIRKLDIRKDSLLITSIENEIKKVILNDFIDNNDWRFSLMPLETNYFLYSDKLEIGLNSSEPKETNISTIKEDMIQFIKDNRGGIGNVLEEIIVNVYHENKSQQYRLKELLSGDIYYNDKNYFILYGTLYEFTEDYNKSIITFLKEGLHQSMFSNYLQTRWKKDWNEDEFNTYSSQNDDYVLFHKCLVNNIEFCDLLKVDTDENTIKVLHVKDGFDGNMRVLLKQIEISMEKINDLRIRNEDPK